VHVLAYVVIGLISMVIPGWILTQNPWFTGAVIAVLMVISPLFVIVHDAMHFPATPMDTEAVMV
jgi:fatty acid desaturase